jgi:hypothetical protein
MPTANLSETGVLNALLSKGKVNALVNLLTLRATSKALKTAIDSRKNLVNKNKIKVLKRKQEQLRTLMSRPQNRNFRMKHKDFRIGKIVSKYFKGYNERPNPNGVGSIQVQVYKMPSGKNVNLPMHGQIFHARDAYLEAQRMKRYKKTILRKNGNRIYFEVPNRGRSFVFNKSTGELNYNPRGGGFSLQSGVKLSDIFSKSNRKRIKAL